MRIAIIGGGSIGRRHAANARMLGHDVDVYDTAPERGNPPWLFRPSDAVLICTPAATHAAVASDLLSLGYRGPLLVEKPIDVVSDSIFRDWPHPVTMVGYNWLFHEELQALHMLVGRPWAARFLCHTNIGAWPGRSYGDPLLECSHELAVALFWLGPSAQLEMVCPYAAGADISIVNDTRDGVLIDVRWDEARARREFFIHQLEPGAVVGLLDEPGWTLRPSDRALYASYVSELQHFLRAVEQAGPTMCSFSEGLRVVEICERVKELAT